MTDPRPEPRIVEVPLSEFHQRRALYAANRDVLWPIGLALTVAKDGDEYQRLYVTQWDFGDGRVETIEDPEPDFDAEFDRYVAERQAKMPAADRRASERARPPQAEGLRAALDALEDAREWLASRAEAPEVQARIEAAQARLRGEPRDDRPRVTCICGRSVLRDNWANHLLRQDGRHAALRAKATRDEGLDVERLGMAMDIVSDGDEIIGVVGRGSYAQRVAEQYAALATPAPKEPSDD